MRDDYPIDYHYSKRVSRFSTSKGKRTQPPKLYVEMGVHKHNQNQNQVLIHCLESNVSPLSYAWLASKSSWRGLFDVGWLSPLSSCCADFLITIQPWYDLRLSAKQLSSPLQIQVLACHTLTTTKQHPKRNQQCHFLAMQSKMQQWFDYFQNNGNQ